MSGSAKKDATKSSTVDAIVTHLARSTNMRKRRYVRNTQPGSVACVAAGGLRIATPRIGAKITATNHDAMSAMATTAKSENVYSPAELAAKPTGMKPAIVTIVPASMAKAYAW